MTATTDAQPDHAGDGERFSGKKSNGRNGATAGRTDVYGGDLLAFLGNAEPDEDDDEDWLIRGVIPRAMPAMLAGYQKIGKTMLAIDMAIALASDAPNWCGHRIPVDVEGCRVLLMPREDHERLTKRRLWQFSRGRDIDPRSLVGRLEVDAVSPLYLDQPDCVDKLRRTCERFDVIFIDSWATMHRVDENSTRDMSLITSAWRDLSLSTGKTIIPLHHFGGKGRTDDNRNSGQRLRGSSVIFSTARWVVGVMEVDPDNPAEGLELDAIGNLAYRPPPFRVRLIQDQHAGFVLLRYESLGSAAEAVDRELDGIILDVLRDAPDGLTMRALRSIVRDAMPRHNGRSGARNQAIDEHVRRLARLDLVWSDTRRRWKTKTAENAS